MPRPCWPTDRWALNGPPPLHTATAPAAPIKPVIEAFGLRKEYAKVLFDDASFQVYGGDVVALVGPNGAGKTTLLRILAGREPFQGSLRCDMRTHWFDQHPEVPKGARVRDLLAAELPVPPALQLDKQRLEARIADPALYEEPGYETVLEEYAEVERQIKLATTPGPVSASPVAGLDIPDLGRKASELSGGQRTRVFLARTLQAARPGDLVVLDEPTNHLDVTSIEWLEDWIGAFDGTVLLVAHDRAFLDTVATRVFEVHDGITCYDGDYEAYVEARDEDRERQRREHARAQDRLAGAKATIMQFRHQKRFDGQYASRMKALERYQAAVERTPDAVMEKMGFGLAFGALEKSSREVLRLSGVDKSYDEPVLQGVELEVTTGDRIGLVGGNGTGKSTLLRILTGQEKKDAGTIHVAPGVRGVYFQQEQDDLEPERTVAEEVRVARDMEDRDVKALMGRFRFHAEVDFGRKVATLSGGERQRLMLLKCVLKPSNLLVLDEPTNHLDLWAKDVVIDALRAYKGTILLASHDRFLLDAVTDDTVVLEGGTLHRYPGSFTATRDAHHRVRSRTTDKRFVVRKRFTDWGADRKYAPDEVFEVSEAAFTASMTLRNALSQGWIEPDA